MYDTKRMNMIERLLVLSLLVLAMTPAVEAQNPAPPTVQAMRVTERPVVDGALDDEVWKAAPETTKFTQRDPNEGQPATQQSFVRVVYDDDAIYFGVRLPDTGPVTSRLGRRDTSIESDSFRVYLDPHFDRRSGAHFGVFASGVQYDSVLYNDTNANVQWDAVWDSATKITPDGWTVEMRIPFSQLRFPDRPVHTWGVNFQRYVSRVAEVSRLVHVPKKESGHVSRFTTMTGISGIHPKRTFELLPYAVARGDVRQTVSPMDPLNEQQEADGDIGVDVKYGLTSNLTLTGTINPDFGQVEVDPAVINLTQFETFFPERRPFFVEGADLFNNSGGISDHIFQFGEGYAESFYSRRIGREPQAIGNHNYDYVDSPGQTTILGAAKITGKTSNGWSLAFLDALTQKEEATLSLGSRSFNAPVEPLTNYLVARTVKDIGKRGSVGALVTAVNRDLGDELNFLRREAYTAALDGYWAFGERDTILEWGAGGSLVRGSSEAILLTQRAPAHYYQRPDAEHLHLDEQRTSLAGGMGRVVLAKQNGRWQYNVGARTFSPGYEPNDIGFMSRADATATHAVVLYNNPEPTKRFRSRSAWVGKYHNWNWDGDVLNNGVSSSFSTQLTNYWSASMSLGAEDEVQDDRATRGGAVINRPASFRYGAGLSSDARKKFAATASTSFSHDEQGGHSETYSVSGTWRPAPNITLRVAPAFRNREYFAQYVRTVTDPLAMQTYGSRYVFADIAQQTFDLGMRVDWTFTSRLTFQLYAQPYVSAGDYEGFKEVSRPRSLDYTTYGSEAGTIAFNAASNRYTVDPDAAGDAGQFGFQNPDFNYRSLRGNAVVRWEFRPGSAVYLVWTENRQDVAPIGDFALGRDFDSTLAAPSDDVFLIKVSYWLGM